MTWATGICKGGRGRVSPQAKTLSCHFHFLRDAGKDLIEPAYRELRGCLRRHAFQHPVSVRWPATPRRLLAEPKDGDNALGDVSGGHPNGCRFESHDSCGGLRTIALELAGQTLRRWLRLFLSIAPCWYWPKGLMILLDCLPRLLQTLPGDKRGRQPLVLSTWHEKVMDVVADPVFEKKPRRATLALPALRSASPSHAQSHLPEAETASTTMVPHPR